MRIIDIHTHGLGGYDTRTTHAEDILNMAKIHGSHGVSEILPTVYAGPIGQMRANVDAVREAMNVQQSALSGQDSGFFKPTLNSQNSQLARIAGVHLEGPFLNPSRPGALNAGAFLPPTEKIFRMLIDGFNDVVRVITIAPELEGSVRLIKAAAEAGITVSLGHSEATYSEAEEGFRAGAKGITHLFNAMRGLHHREPGIVGFGLINPDVFVEIIADPFHLDPRVLDLVFKVKNPEKIIIISDSVKNTDFSHDSSGITDGDGTLQGGSMTVTEAAKRLILLGLREGLVMPCISTNPVSFLYSL